MNVKEIAVTNATNFSFFMVNFSYALLQPFRSHNPEYSILDLKSPYRGCRYAFETIKMLPHIVPMSFGKNLTPFYWLTFFSKSPAWAPFIQLFNPPLLHNWRRY